MWTSKVGVLISKVSNFGTVNFVLKTFSFYLKPRAAIFNLTSSIFNANIKFKLQKQKF